ncbi:FixH family protein [Oharaeibacter diazotrophicus]|uniref:Nitrogen fixation protein FixH n=1 Tax=Oharaeibacter diazotrophicus TaxID=1920512 RepID=A0A4R6RFM4_9HYPH|nr:FixH family protein [Oharaeibacter diazotrophicus]TDP85201.1 nitrogen fixation protein FixH [Oharaeibacter diazotrophicus]BBE74171.1 FixH protein [Pleomorphomonas sp. SM30]GLS76141.1 nitrogen fixation protein FixH [Oharaeibacter diazotrophicus]
MTASTDAANGRPLTGWGVLAWVIGFFAVIFAANGAFIYLAVSTFPGVEVASSYKAGQDYEADVAAAEAQAARGWVVDAHPALNAAGAAVSVTFHDRDGVAIAGLDVTVTLAHTVDTAHDRTVVLTETAPGAYSGELDGIRAGRWTLVLDAERRGERVFMSRNVVDLQR